MSGERERRAEIAAEAEEQEASQARKEIGKGGAGTIDGQYQFSTGTRQCGSVESKTSRRRSNDTSHMRRERSSEDQRRNRFTAARGEETRRCHAAVRSDEQQQYKQRVREAEERGSGRPSAAAFSEEAMSQKYRQLDLREERSV